MVIRFCVGGPDDGSVTILAPEVPERCVIVGTWMDDMKDLHPDGYYAFEAYARYTPTVKET